MDESERHANSLAMRDVTPSMRGADWTVVPQEMGVSQP